LSSLSKIPCSEPRKHRLRISKHQPWQPLSPYFVVSVRRQTVPFLIELTDEEFQVK
jgi:hypothetical protein